MHHITVFEHEILRYDIGDNRITEEQFNALERYHGDGIPYYKLIYHGIQFNEHVGVIQVGNILIEVLPKADKNETDATLWRNRLIGMLKAVGTFDIKSPSSGKLNIKPNTVLDLYFELFTREVENLLHSGLIKQYRRKEGNVTALKGSLQFGKHLQQNLIHHERFYVKHTHYDVNHKLHFILYKAIKLLGKINTNTGLQSRIGSLLLNFPEMQDMKVSETTFEKLVFNRKSEQYRGAIEIAKLLLLQFHPDVAKGKNHVLALMFDMNLLWEQFVYVSLRKNKEPGTTITAQTSKYFWKPENGRRTCMRPDIFIKTDKGNIVLDTKWKNLNGYNPSPADLRQMYVYHEYYNASKVALVYPGTTNSNNSGHYLQEDVITAKNCSVISIAVATEISVWQSQIFNMINVFATT
ncbi:McrC family protein [Flavobacterium sp.]|uniref:McrC family protein n=1 Tax=Flavobacterium sp. TaxID=239 RepID=UPI0040331C2A